MKLATREPWMKENRASAHTTLCMNAEFPGALVFSSHRPRHLVCSSTSAITSITSPSSIRSSHSFNTYRKHSLHHHAVQDYLRLLGHSPPGACSGQPPRYRVRKPRRLQWLLRLLRLARREQREQPRRRHLRENPQLNPGSAGDRHSGLLVLRPDEPGLAVLHHQRGFQGYLPGLVQRPPHQRARLGELRRRRWR